MDHSLTFMMCAEKTINLIFTIENTLIFFKENDIKADEQVIKALEPVLENLKKWMKDGRDKESV